MTIDLVTRQSLMDLHAGYAFTMDEGDAEAWADCFTVDGVLKTTRPLLVRGRPELIAFARDRAASSTDPARHVTWHHTYAPLADGDVAGRCSAAVLETTAAGVRAMFTATYDDRFSLAGGAWLLSRRSVRIDSAPVVPD